MSREDRETAFRSPSDFCDEGVLEIAAWVVSVVYRLRRPACWRRFQSAWGGTIDIGLDINRFSLRQNISQYATVTEWHRRCV